MRIGIIRGTCVLGALLLNSGIGEAARGKADPMKRRESISVQRRKSPVARRHRVRQNLELDSSRWTLLGTKKFFASKSARKLFPGIDKKLGGVQSKTVGKQTALSLFRPTRRENEKGKLIDGFERVTYVAKNESILPESAESKARNLNKVFLENFHEIADKSLYGANTDNVYRSIRSQMELGNVGNTRDTLSLLTAGIVTGLRDPHASFTANYNAQMGESQSLRAQEQGKMIAAPEFKSMVHGNRSVTEVNKIPYVYARIEQFDFGTARQMEVLVKSLESVTTDTGADKARALVLDLRGNPGGHVLEANRVISMLASKPGTYMSEYQRNPKTGKVEVTKELEIAKPGTLAHLPLVILVDKGSASSSELVTGALKEKSRAIVVGTNTYGKGIGQFGGDLPSGDKAAFTMLAIKFNKNKESYHGKGIKPNVEFDGEALLKKGIPLGEINKAFDTTLNSIIEKFVEHKWDEL